MSPHGALDGAKQVVVGVRPLHQRPVGVLQRQAALVSVGEEHEGHLGEGEKVCHRDGRAPIDREVEHGAVDGPACDQLLHVGQRRRRADDAIAGLTQGTLQVERHHGFVLDHEDLAPRHLVRRQTGRRPDVALATAGSGKSPAPRIAKRGSG